MRRACRDHAERAATCESLKATATSSIGRLEVYNAVLTSAYGHDDLICSSQSRGQAYCLCVNRLEA